VLTAAVSHCLTHQALLSSLSNTLGCSSTVAGTQLPAPLALVVGGLWTAQSAGGRYPEQSWPSNPQMMVLARQAAQVMITLTRTDTRHAALKDDGAEAPPIGLAITEVLHQHINALKLEASRLHPNAACM
jgi:hypothetical protein